MLGVVGVYSDTTVGLFLINLPSNLQVPPVGLLAAVVLMNATFPVNLDKNVLKTNKSFALRPHVVQDGLALRPLLPGYEQFFLICNQNELNKSWNCKCKKYFNRFPFVIFHNNLYQISFYLFNHLKQINSSLICVLHLFSSNTVHPEQHSIHHNVCLS